MMNALLCLYFLPFILCVLAAKYTKDEDYLVMAYMPLVNVVGAGIGLVFISYDLLETWVKE